MPGITTRIARRQDAPQLTDIINTIIAIGGTTAYESPLSEAEFSDHFILGSECITCTVAINNNELCGFQSLSAHHNQDDQWASIATFARVEPKVSGVGYALFERTKQLVHNTNVRFMDATIRADNSSGLGYYEKIGFVDYGITKAMPLSDGTLIDRLHKRFDL